VDMTAPCSRKWHVLGVSWQSCASSALWVQVSVLVGLGVASWTYKIDILITLLHFYYYKVMDKGKRILTAEEVQRAEKRARQGPPDDRLIFGGMSRTPSLHTPSIPMPSLQTSLDGMHSRNQVLCP
jgi:hypothetical protein